jgi:hypothetical protein
MPGGKDITAQKTTMALGWRVTLQTRARVLAGVLFLLGAAGHANATMPSDTSLVLRALTRHYCTRNKPSLPILSSTAEILDDNAENRIMLRDYFRDGDAVNDYFANNRKDVKLPAGNWHSCFSVTEGRSRFALSVPAFNRSRNFAFVYLGELGNHAEIYVLQLRARRWRVIERIAMWVS